MDEWLQRRCAPYYYAQRYKEESCIIKEYLEPEYRLSNDIYRGFAEGTMEYTSYIAQDPSSGTTQWDIFPGFIVLRDSLMNNEIIYIDLEPFCSDDVPDKDHEIYSMISEALRADDCFGNHPGYHEFVDDDIIVSVIFDNNDHKLSEIITRGSIKYIHELHKTGSTFYGFNDHYVPPKNDSLVSRVYH